MTNLANPPSRRNPLAGVKSAQSAGSQAARDALAKRMREAFAIDPTVRPPGEKFLFWLGEAARRLREEAGLGPAIIAGQLNRREATIESFEKGVHMPRDLEAILTAYARCVGVDDPRDIVRDALRLWYEHGEAPASNNSSG